MSIILQESFTSPEFDRRLQWTAPPSHWWIDSEAGHLVIEPDAKTDFWQRTHYGFQRDNGHFLGLASPENWTVTVEVSMKPVHQYDQAGAMIRFSPECWMKTSVEYEKEGPSKLGVVVTNHGYSDWSTQDYPDAGSPVLFRIQREENDYQVFFSGEPHRGGWSQLRVAHLAHPVRASVQFGLYTCCPTTSGLQVRFHSLVIEDHPAKE